MLETTNNLLKKLQPLILVQKSAKAKHAEAHTMAILHMVAANIDTSLKLPVRFYSAHTLLSLMAWKKETTHTINKLPTINCLFLILSSLFNVGEKKKCICL